jgi:hypothetical protein
MKRIVNSFTFNDTPRLLQDFDFETKGLLKAGDLFVFSKDLCSSFDSG